MVELSNPDRSLNSLYCSFNLQDAGDMIKFSEESSRCLNIGKQKKPNRSVHFSFAPKASCHLPLKNIKLRFFQGLI